MLKLGLIVAIVGYVLLYYKITRWLDKRSDAAIVKARTEQQQAIVDKYRVKGYNVERRQFAELK